MKATSAPTRDTFADLHRACHRWLMKRDPGYAKSHAYFAGHREAYNERRGNKKKAPSTARLSSPNAKPEILNED